MIEIKNNDDWSRHVRQSSGPVLLILHSPWSAYSRRSLACLQEIELELGLSCPARFCSLDIDGDGWKDGGLAFETQVTAIPAFYVFEGGKQTHRAVGERSKKSLLKLLQGFFA